MANDKTYKDQSRINWVDKSREIPTHEQVRTGCMQRMADATEQIAKNTEAMAKNYNYLLSDNEYYKRRHQEMQQELETSRKQTASYKGHYHRLKNKFSKD